MSRFKWLYIGAVLAALIQSGLLYAGIEKRASILRSGKEVVVQTEPLDPRDLMRGDYVILGYDFSSIERSKFIGHPVDGSQAVYIVLKSGADGSSEMSRAGFVPFADLAADEVQLQGEALYSISDNADSTVQARFGIERYYVPEGQGHAIEDAQRERRITAVIAVTPSGQAQIKALRDDGKPLYDEPLY